MQIGTITLTRPRVYTHEGADAYVNPGEFPVFQENGEVFWIMPARRNGGGNTIERLGHGTFAISQRGDYPVGEEFTMESVRMSRDDFDAMNADDETMGALVFHARS